MRWLTFRSFACAGPAAVLGDIHGCAEALRALLPQLAGRDLFVIGGVCDRASHVSSATITRTGTTPTPAQCLALDRPVIMGHRPLPQPLLASHVLAIDTGAGTTSDGRLTALLLPERRTLSLPAPRL